MVEDAEIFELCLYPGKEARRKSSDLAILPWILWIRRNTASRPISRPGSPQRRRMLRATFIFDLQRKEALLQAPFFRFMPELDAKMSIPAGRGPTTSRRNARKDNLRAFPCCEDDNICAINVPMQPSVRQSLSPKWLAFTIERCPWNLESRTLHARKGAP